MPGDSTFRSTVEALALICVLLLCETRNGWAQNLAIVPTPNIGHTRAVGLLAISADGRHLVSSDGTTIRLWQLSSGRLVRTLAPLPAKDRSEDQNGNEAHEAPRITALVIARDGAIVIGTDDSNRLHQWDAISGRLQKTVNADEWGSSIVIAPDGNTVISMCSFRIKSRCGIARWEITTLERRAARDGSADQIAMNSNGTEAVATDHDSAVLLSLPSLDIKKPLPAAKRADLARITDTGNEIEALQYSDDFITWRFIELASGSVTGEFKFSRAEGSIGPFALGPGSRLLVARNPSSVHQNIVEILSPGPGGLEKVRLARDFQPTAAVFSGDGSSVVTSEGNLIEIWDTRTGVLQRTLEGPSTIKTISSSADGKHLLALDAAGSAFVWRPFEAELNGPPLINTGRIEDAAISNDGQTAMFATKDRALITRPTSGNAGPSLPQGWLLKGDDSRLRRRPGSKAPLIGIVRDDSFAFALWDSEKAAFRRRLTLPKDAGHPDWTVSSTDGVWAVLSAQSQRSFLLWNLDNNTVELRLANLRGKPVIDASFSPDSKLMAIVASHSTVRAGDVEEGGIVQVRRLGDRKIVKELLIKDGPGLSSVEFSPSGKYLLVYTVRFERFGRYIYRTADWKRVDEEEHNYWVENDITFSLKDERILETEVSDEYLTKFILKTGWGTGSLKLVDLAFTSREVVDGVPPTAVDAKGERIALADGAEVVIIQASDGALTRLEGRHLGNISTIQFLPDDDWLATGGSDGTVRLWNLRRKALAATFIASRDGQWLAVTPAGFYFGSDRPGHLMSVAQGLDVYSVEQFFGPLYRPDLVKEQLTGDLMGLHADAAAQLNLAAVLEKGAAPMLELLDKNRTRDSIMLKVRIANNSGGGIGKRLIWRVNGTPAGRTEPDELRSRADRDAPVEVTEGLRLDFNHMGGNVITVVAFNEAEDPRLALASEPLEIHVSGDGVSTENAPQPRMHILAIGVNSYDTRLHPEEEPKLDPLTLAVADVQSLKRAIAEVSANGGYGKGLSLERTEAEATRDRIADAFNELSGSVNPQDAFVLLIAGHGHSVDGRYYYYPITTKIGGGRNYVTEGIPTETWQTWLAKVPAGKKLVIIDTCKSGDFLQRGDAQEETAIDRLRRAIGRSVITAARDSALESRHLNHGILTYAILKALSTPRPDGKDIYLSTLKERIPPDVEKLSTDLGEPPQRTRILIEDDFPLGLPLASVAPPPINLAKTLPGDWALRDTTKVRRRAAWDAEVNETLEEGTKVAISRYQEGWVLIVNKGTEVGWVPVASLLKLKE
jgi:WD40 repeat protein